MYSGELCETPKVQITMLQHVLQFCFVYIAYIVLCFKNTLCTGWLNLRGGADLRIWFSSAVIGQPWFDLDPQIHTAETAARRARHSVC